MIESHDGHIARIEQLKEEYGISEDVHQKVCCLRWEIPAPAGLCVSALTSSKGCFLGPCAGFGGGRLAFGVDTDQ